ncbi:MAG TPA: hypothetical protein PK631_05180 [Erysipelotrichaceae bacterium]|jgi:hypothetical protein|nr:hypothetical protein [Erysipelotrichaceae bacterium]
MSDELKTFRELITEDNYSFYTSSHGDMFGSYYSTGIYQLDENSAFVSICRRADHNSPEEREQFKVSIAIYNQIFELIKQNRLVELEKARKEEFMAFDAATTDYHIRIGNKRYRFDSYQKIDQKRREIIWKILDLIHSEER